MLVPTARIAKDPTLNHPGTENQIQDLHGTGSLQIRDLHGIDSLRIRDLHGTDSL